MKRNEEKEGRYTFNAHVDGTFSICFSNQMSAFSSKELIFEWKVERDSPEDSLAKVEHLNPLGVQIVELSSLLSLFETEQRYLKMREIRLRNSMNIIILRKKMN